MIDKSMDKIVALCKNRGFVYPGSEIYGGLANSWDYGPLGAELKKNIKDMWWKKFINEFEGIKSMASKKNVKEILEKLEEIEKKEKE